MPLLKYLNLLRHIDRLISKKSTGSPNELAKKLNVSRSTALEYLKEMKEEGFPIKYDKARTSYYYEEDVSIPKKIFLSNDEMKKIAGGITLINFFPCTGLSPEIPDCV